MLKIIGCKKNIRSFDRSLLQIQGCLLQIRIATSNDLDALTHLWYERRVILNQSDPRFSVPDETGKQAWLDQMQARLAGNPLVFVGEHEGQVCGFITGEERAGLGIVDEMALDAHTYHSGLGRALWQHLHEALQQAGNSEIRVCVPRYHAVEQAFWRALGAVEWRERPDDKQWQLPPQLIWMKF